MSLSAARSRMMQARTQMEANQLDDVEATLAAAMRFLDAVPDAEKAPLVGEIETIRVELSTRLKPAEGGSVPTPVSTPAPAAAAISDESRRTETWTAIQRDIEGWEREAIPAEVRAAVRAMIDVPHFPKTRLAIQRIRYFLDDPDTRRNRGDAALEATYRRAERIFDAAATKLHAAFTHVLDEADKLPAPLRSLELDRAGHLMHAAEYALRGTHFREAIVARARGLDERWKAEYAAAMKARQELFDKLDADADVAWPELVASAHAVDFALDTAVPGTTVLLSRVYNRAGWDFSGEYAFAMRVDGMPLAGNYEPHVLAALEHAWYELELDVGDRFRWDVLAVVEGFGTIGQRTIATLRSKDTGVEIGQLEEHRPVECIRLRIIGLHAGPVAVGPRH
jgi:hypothetical protein